MPTTLTERYIAATVKSLPATTQEDVRAELEASIADAVEAHVEQGTTAVDAERVVLTELGDPAALAAGYADRPLHLLGPRYYLTWWRLLKLLLAIVPACAAVGVALGQVLSGAGIGTVIGQTLSVGLATVVHVCFWTTIVFVVLERTGADTGTPWDVDQLPEPHPSGRGRADLIPSLVFLGLFAGALIWDQLRGFVYVGGEGFPILNPALWPWWILGLGALTTLEAALAIVLYIRGRWTAPAAIANTALAVLFMSWSLTLLGRGQLINPALIDLVVTRGDLAPDTLRTLTALLVFGIVGVSVWDIIDGWLKVRRDRG